MRALILLLLLVLPAPAAAEVVSASANGFEVRDSVPLVVVPDTAFRAFAKVADWWDPQHTYSGDSANLSLSLVPGGCFCERFPKTGGGIEHLRVTAVEPGKHIVLTGALGPLLSQAAVGVMDIEIAKSAGGSLLTIDYKAAGFASGGADKLAGAVDQVIASQLKRFRAYVTALPRT